MAVRPGPQAVLIAELESRGIPVSPFMHYWALSELTRYCTQHLTPDQYDTAHITLKGS